ncbi:hypothetical protein HKD37_01G001575 [Glycine soja]
MPSQIIITQQKTNKTTHHISQNPIPTKFKRERSPPKPEISKSHSFSRFSASVGASFRKQAIYIKTLRIKPRAWFRDAEHFTPKLAESGTKESPKNSFHYLERFVQKVQFWCVFYCNWIMATDPTSPPQSDGQSEATSKRSRTTTRLRTLTLRTVDQPIPAVYVDPATGRASGPMREKFHSYLGVVAREKVPIIHNNWKDVPETLKEIVWNDILDALRVYSDLGFSRNLMDFMVTTKEPEFLRDVDGTEHSSNSAEQVSGSSSRILILLLLSLSDSFLGSFWIEGHIASWLNNLFAKFDIAEATKVKTKVMSTVATRWRQFKSTLTSKFVFAKTEGQQTQDVVTKYGLDPEAWKQFEETRLTPNWEGIRKRAQSIQKHNDCPHVLSRGGYDLLEKKLLDQKRKRIQEEALLSENPASVDEPPSPIKRHVKWKVARTRAVGNMTSDSAQEIADKIDSLEEQVTQDSFVPHGRQDILNTAIGRPDHGGRVRATGSGVTITQYYGRASRTCSSSSTSISQQQLDEVVARLREDMTGQIREELRTQIKEELRTQLEEENKRSLEIMTNALKEAIKKELSNKGSQEALQIQPDIQQLGVRVSTQGSNAVTNAQASQEHDADAIPLMGLFVQRNDGTQRLVAMGKIMEGDSIIHTVAYADDVVRVSVETVIDPKAEVPYATSEIQYVKQAVNTFVAWPTHLVKAVLDEHPQRIPHNEDAHVPKPANVNADDPLRELMKYSFDLYDKPLQISFDGRFLGIVDASTSIFITYSDVIEIIAGDKSLNISVIQLWLMYIHEWSQIFSQGFMYAFLEPQSLVCSKDRRSECEQYLERWLKESDREVYIGPYFHQKPDMHIKATINSVMTKLKKTLSPETKAVAPKWIEVKSHVQTGCYECGYYIMHWIWNIIVSDIKSDWSMWFANDTPLDIGIITTIRKKWATFFLKTAITAILFSQQFSAAIVPPSLPLQQLSEQMKCPQSLDGCLVEMILSFDLAFALIPLLKFSSSKVTSSTSIEERVLEEFVTCSGKWKILHEESGMSPLVLVAYRQLFATVSIAPFAYWLEWQNTSTTVLMKTRLYSLIYQQRRVLQPPSLKPQTTMTVYTPPTLTYYQTTSVVSPPPMLTGNKTNTGVIGTRR